MQSGPLDSVMSRRASPLHSLIRHHLPFSLVSNNTIILSYGDNLFHKTGQATKMSFNDRMDKGAPVVLSSMVRKADHSRSTSLHSPWYGGHRVRRAAPPRYKCCPGVVCVEESGCYTLKEGRTKVRKFGTNSCIGCVQAWARSIDGENLLLKNSPGWAPAIQRLVSQAKLPRSAMKNARKLE